MPFRMTTTRMKLIDSTKPYRGQMRYKLRPHITSSTIVQTCLWYLLSHIKAYQTKGGPSALKVCTQVRETSHR